MRVHTVRALGVGLGLLGLIAGGCAAPKPVPQPSKQEIHEDSDRFFERLRQEEQAHGAGPEGRE